MNRDNLINEIEELKKAGYSDAMISAFVTVQAIDRLSDMIAKVNEPPEPEIAEAKPEAEKPEMVIAAAIGNFMQKLSEENVSLIEQNQASISELMNLFVAKQNEMMHMVHTKLEPVMNFFDRFK